MESGILNVNIVTLLWQLLNTIILVALIFAIYYLLFKRPTKYRLLKKRMDEIEREVGELRKEKNKRG